jgi:hypothetical protein
VLRSGAATTAANHIATATSHAAHSIAKTIERAGTLTARNDHTKQGVAMPIKGDRLRWPPRPGKKFSAGAPSVAAARYQ